MNCKKSADASSSFPATSGLKACELALTVRKLKCRPKKLESLVDRFVVNLRSNPLLFVDLAIKCIDSS